MVSGWFQRDVFRGTPLQSRGGMSLPGLPSIARLGARRYWVSVTIFRWVGPARCPATVLFLLSGVPNQFAFFLWPFRASLGCLLNDFSGFIVVLYGDEQGDTGPQHLVHTRSQVTLKDELSLVLKRLLCMFRNIVIPGAKVFLSVPVCRHCCFEAAVQPPSFFWDVVLGAVREAAGEDKGSTANCFEKRNAATQVPPHA